MTAAIARLALACACSAGLVVATSTAPAQTVPSYPARPIHIVVTFTPGGAPDILARLIGERLTSAGVSRC